jgi:hypothetical protein
VLRPYAVARPPSAPERTVQLGNLSIRLVILPHDIAAHGDVRVAWYEFKSAIRGLLAGDGRRRFEGPSQHYHITNPYHAVSVTPCPVACSFARRLRGRRFLSREAPQLPLPGCPLANCQCAYKHHDDRRRKLRRDWDRMERPQSWSGPERRQTHGRRVTDLP